MNLSGFSSKNFDVLLVSNGLHWAETIEFRIQRIRVRYDVAHHRRSKDDLILTAGCRLP